MPRQESDPDPRKRRLPDADDRSAGSTETSGLQKSNQPPSEPMPEISDTEFEGPRNPYHPRMMAYLAAIGAIATGGPYLFHLPEALDTPPAQVPLRAMDLNQDLEQNKSLQIILQAVEEFLTIKFNQMSRLNEFQVSAREDYAHIIDDREDLAIKTSALLLEEIQAYEAYLAGELTQYRDFLTLAKTGDAYKVREIVKDYPDTLPNKPDETPAEFVSELARKFVKQNQRMSISSEPESEVIEESDAYYLEVINQIKQMADQLAENYVENYADDANDLNKKVLSRLIERELIELVEDQDILNYLRQEYTRESMEVVRSLSQGTGITFELELTNTVYYQFSEDEVVKVGQPVVFTPERPSEEESLVIALADTVLFNTAKFDPFDIVRINFDAGEHNDNIEALRQAYARIFIVAIQTAEISDKLNSLSEERTGLLERAREEKP